MANDFQGYTLPALTGGLNLVDAIDNMDPNDALELENVLPDGLSSRVRAGYSLKSTTAVTKQIQSLFDLALEDGSHKIVGATDAAFWEFSVTPATNITGATTPTNGAWKGEGFAHRLYLCNGVDNMQVYDGTTMADSTFTGLALSDIINVSSYNERLYFIEKNSLSFWYGDVQAVGASALTEYPLKYFMKKGGYLLFAGSWTNQTSQSSQDLFFVCSSEGEILFFGGQSPEDLITPWGIVARYVIGKPMGFRAFLRVNEDIWIITEQGIVPVSSLFTLDPTSSLDVVSRKINPLISEFAYTQGISHMWHGIHWPLGRRVFVVIPTSGTDTLLLVYSQNSKGWTTYKLQNTGDACSIAVSDGDLYYGSASGKCFNGETGQNDNDEAIAYNGRGAFNFFGSRGNYKRFADIRPLMLTAEGIEINLGIDTNFQRQQDLGTVVTTEGASTPWGSPWGSDWSAGEAYIFDRHATKGQGHCGAVRFAGSVKNVGVEFFGFEVRFKSGDQV